MKCNMQIVWQIAIIEGKGVVMWRSMLICFTYASSRRNNYNNNNNYSNQDID